MSLLNQYVDFDVVKHFAGLISDTADKPVTITIFGEELNSIIEKYELKTLLPENVIFSSDKILQPKLFEQNFIDRVIAFAQTEKSIVTIKKKYIDLKGTSKTLFHYQNKGLDIRIVDDILGAMVVASKKRRNKVVFPIMGYEDEALITAAGLAKAKTVGFRNFFVFNKHTQLAGIANSSSEKENSTNGYLVPLKVGLNTGLGAYSRIALANNKSLIISGYEVKDIIQSIWMIVSQQNENKPQVLFQRTSEVSDEIINRARWMLEEVFEPADLQSEILGSIPNGAFKIKKKYQTFDAEKMLAM